MNFIAFILMKPVMNLITIPNLNNYLDKILVIKFILNWFYAKYFFNLWTYWDYLVKPTTNSFSVS